MKRQSPGCSCSGWLAILLLAGCQARALSPEPSFAEKLAAVRAGRSDRILVEQTPLADESLAQLAGAADLRELLIDNDASRLTAAGVRHLNRLPNLAHLRIRGPGIDDMAVAEIAQIKSLQILNVPRADFSDAGLAELAKLPNLVQLRLGSPRVTDAGMKTLAALPALKRLHLIDVPIGDAGLAELAKFEGLQSLYLDGGKFSDAAVEALFMARPDLHVHFNQAHHDRDPHAH